MSAPKLAKEAVNDSRSAPSISPTLARQRRSMSAAGVRRSPNGVSSICTCPMFSAVAKPSPPPGPPPVAARPPAVEASDRNRVSPVSASISAAAARAPSSSRVTAASVRSNGAPSGRVTLADIELPSMFGKKMKRTVPVCTRPRQNRKKASAAPIVA